MICSRVKPRDISVILHKEIGFDYGSSLLLACYLNTFRTWFSSPGAAACARMELALLATAAAAVEGVEMERQWHGST
jgi:hypothetical protein